MINFIRGSEFNRARAVTFKCDCGCTYKSSLYSVYNINNFMDECDKKYSVSMNCPECGGENTYHFNSFEELEDTKIPHTEFITYGVFHNKPVITYHCRKCDVIFDSDEYMIFASTKLYGQERRYDMEQECPICSQKLRVPFNATRYKKLRIQNEMRGDSND